MLVVEYNVWVDSLSSGYNAVVLNDNTTNSSTSAIVVS